MPRESYFHDPRVLRYVRVSNRSSFAGQFSPSAHSITGYKPYSIIIVGTRYLKFARQYDNIVIFSYCFDCFCLKYNSFIYSQTNVVFDKDEFCRVLLVISMWFAI